jgi:hypothetical protein
MQAIQEDDPAPEPSQLIGFCELDEGSLPAVLG